MNTIKLDKQEVIKHMWDSSQGSNVLAVAPDGSEYGIRWLPAHDRAWNNWPSDWLVIGIPALYPEGSGAEQEAAAELLLTLGLQAESFRLRGEALSYPVEEIKRLAPNEWKKEQTELANWLAEAFLAACNSNGLNLISDIAPWGVKVKPPAKFEWMKEE